MKKIQMILGLLVILTLFVLSAQAVLADTKSRDVPSNHPAYLAVKMLLDEGYLQLYQDQTFQGDKPVDRFTLAILVARILDEISSGKIGTSKSDIDMLRNLTNELHEELLALTANGEIFSKKLEDLSRQNQILKEDLTNTSARLSDDQIQLQKEAEKMIADFKGLQQKMGSLEEQNTQMKTSLDQALTKLNQANMDLNEAKTELVQSKTALAEMNAGLEQTKNENNILRMKQKSQQTYLWVALILAVIGIVH